MADGAYHKRDLYSSPSLRLAAADYLRGLALAEPIQAAA
jgi:hypothetical protein